MSLHHSHHPAMRQTLAALGLLLIGLLLAMALPPLGLTPLGNDYLPLHALLEISSVGISMIVFVVGWNAYSRQLPGNLVLLACAFLGVGWLDSSHVLSFPGMPDYVTPSSTEKGIAFWLAARTLASAALLIACISPWRTFRSPLTRYLLLASVFTLCSLVHAVVLFAPELLPRTFVPGSGLTPLKIASEYLLVGTNLLTAAILWRRMQQPQPFNAAALFGAVCTIALSEFFFTLYGRADDLFNLLGHLYKIVAYIFLYRAIYVESVESHQRQLSNAQNQLYGTLQTIPDLLWLKDVNGIYLSCNPQFERFFGARASDIVGKTDYDFVDRATADNFRESDRQAMLAGEPQRSEKWLTFAEGGYRGQFETVKTPLRDESGKVIGVLGISRDITQHRQAEERIRHLALSDPLTELPNRRLLLERLQQALNNCEQSGRHGALLFIDLDDFKTLNDSLGHNSGDQLLQQVAWRLATCASNNDTVARLSGDEFVVLLGNLGADPSTAHRQAEQFGLRLLELLSQPYWLRECEQHSTSSIGIALFGSQPLSVDELLKMADLALYRAKADGRNTLRFFDPEMQASVTARAALETDLRQSLLQHDFALHYQPQVNHQGQLIGAEVLLRWPHPQRGMVSPAEFIPLAEATGLILPLGQWVLKTACEQLAAWASHPQLSRIEIAVNISARQIHHPDFVNQVRDTLKQTGAPAARLKLELTESLLLDDVETIISKMQALKGEGVSFSLDDFGTGYSSLSYLKRLPLDQLKIDQSFVRDLLTDPYDAAIARTIVDLARSLGLQVIAEGVETEAQRNMLATEGCLNYQGYLFGRPGPAATLEALVANMAVAAPGTRRLSL